MAKRKRSRRGYSRKRKGHRSDKRFPVLLALPVIAPTVDAASALFHGRPIKDTAAMFVSDLSGVDPLTGTISMPTVTRQLTLVVMGVVGHKIANKLGINRTMKKIPLLGQYIKL